MKELDINLNKNRRAIGDVIAYGKSFLSNNFVVHNMKQSRDLITKQICKSTKY